MQNDFEMPEGLRDLLGKLGATNERNENIEKAKKPICMASKEVRDEFDALQKLKKVTKRLVDEIQARSDLIWVKIKSDPKLEDYEYLQYDPKSEMIMGCTEEEVDKCKE